MQAFEYRGVELFVAPSNKGMEPTSKSVTSIACARGVPLFLAAHARR